MGKCFQLINDFCERSGFCGLYPYSGLTCQTGSSHIKFSLSDLHGIFYSASFSTEKKDASLHPQVHKVQDFGDPSYSPLNPNQADGPTAMHSYATSHFASKSFMLNRTFYHKVCQLCSSECLALLSGHDYFSY